MMKLLVPLVIALVGLGAGVGAGIALKPAPMGRRERSTPNSQRQRNEPRTKHRGRLCERALHHGGCGLGMRL